MTLDTKVVSKIIEIILTPKLRAFAERNGLIMTTPTMQNYYPDLTFKDKEGNYFAVDFKTSYYTSDNPNSINGLTLGSYWGYFRNRKEKMSMDRPYGDYCCHLVLGVLYQQNEESDLELYSIDQLDQIVSPISNFIFFVQPKWKIAATTAGSGNTRNMGGIKNIKKLISGSGPFTKFGEKGEEIFDDYWMHYYNADDKKKSIEEGKEGPFYSNWQEYQNAKGFLKENNITEEPILF